MPMMTVEPDGEKVPVKAGETILDAMYNSGYAYRIGCRRGGCAICKVDLLTGEVDYAKPVCDTVLTDQERTDGTCLSCRAVPRGDVTIRLRDERIRLTNAMLRQYRLAQYEKESS
jgi:ferredoxin